MRHSYPQMRFHNYPAVDYNKDKNKGGKVFAPFNIIDFDSRDAAAAGIIRGLLEKQGNPIGPYDVQIADQAVAKSLILVTHNVSEFGKVPNLTVEDWVA